MRQNSQSARYVCNTCAPPTDAICRGDNSASLRDALRQSTPYVTAIRGDTRGVAPLPSHACAIQLVVRKPRKRG